MRTIVEKLNKRFAEVQIGGKVRIHDENSGFFLGLQDFRQLINGQDCMHNGKKTAQSKVWLSDPDRQTYESVQFYPGKLPDHIYNSYEGWKISPKQGDWNLFQEHIRDNICGSRADYYKWLISWMAHNIQEPHKKMGTAIVIRGLPGTGKTVFAEGLGKLYGNHFVSVNQGSQITNHFNSLYERCLLLCADEAAWAGDRKGEGALKGLITADKLFITRKGLEGYYQNNFTQVIFTTNSEWAVPKAQHDRRFFVLDIGNGWKRDGNKFGKLISQMEHGGCEAMMYDLERFDWTTVDLRNPPETAGGDEVIELSEPKCISWWREYVGETLDWPDGLSKKDMMTKMVQYCHDHGDRHPPIATAFFRQLYKYGNFEETRPISACSGERERFLRFPDRKICMKNLRMSG